MAYARRSQSISPNRGQPLSPNSRHLSSPSSPTSSIVSNASSNASKNWEILKENMNLVEISDFIKKSLPPNKGTTTQNRTYCIFCTGGEVQHKMKRAYRCCIDNDECSVKYRIDSCEKANKGTIFTFGLHNHEVSDKYECDVGLPAIFKKAIDQIMQFHPHKYPNHVRLQLNLEPEKFGTVGLKVPELSQIQGYIHRNRVKVELKSNKLEDVRTIILDHLYFPTINENQPFFFGLQFDANRSPIIGDGSKISPFHLFITSLKLLRNADSSNQNYVALYHVVISIFF
jgi:hypothetical protein